MRYTQPHGLPEDPLGTYTRFITGNPAIGVEGSIPPGPSLDEDQIEIVTVITNAGLVPSHADLTQLWQALQALFAQKFITTPITKTVHGTGADFPNLIEALQWLGQYVITATGSVTFLVAAGPWTYTQSVEINHPNSSRIFIQGAGLLSGTPTPGNISVTGYSAAARSTDIGVQYAYLKTVHATELIFTSGVNGFNVITGGCTLRYMLITGSQTIAAGSGSNLYGNPYQGNGIFCQSKVFVDGVSICKFGSCGIYIDGAGSVDMSSSLSLVCVGNSWQGINCFGGNFTGASGAGGTAHVILCSNAVAGVSLFGGVFWAENLNVRGHGPPTGNAGVHCEQGGLLAANTSQVALNNNGLIAAGAATIVMQQGDFSDNGDYGANVSGTSTCFFDDSVFSGNGSYSIMANNNCFVEALACVLSEPTTPLLNTVGNNEAFILG